MAAFENKKERQKSRRRTSASRKVLAENRARLAELERLNAVDRKRRATPCKFLDGISREEFSAFARKAAQQFKRISQFTVDGATVYCTAESQSGISSWDFSVDFNNWGHITGAYWINSENDKSGIPENFGNKLATLITETLSFRDIKTTDLSRYVAKNKALETENGLAFYKRQVAFKRLTPSANIIETPYTAVPCIGEHLYPVLSMLKDVGFRNVQIVEISDVRVGSKHFIYEVEDIQVAKHGSLYDLRPVNSRSKLIVSYHTKMKIEVPKSIRRIQHMGSKGASDYLVGLGFSNVRCIAMNDLKFGWFTKEGEVDDITVGTGKENNAVKLCQGNVYFYDEPIVIQYHSLRKKRRESF